MTLFRHLLAAAVLAFFAAPALAGGGVERLYTVYGIAVDETAKTAAEARLIAVEKAENEAFQRLIAKLASDSDAWRVGLPEGARAADYVLGFEVVEEKNSRVRYIGRINVSFDQRKVEELFGRAGASYVSIPPAPVLVLPLLAQDGAYLLWEDGNIFRAAWAKADIQNRLADFRLPEGTLEERASITTEVALSGRQRERLSDLAARYGANDVWIALARFGRDNFGNLLGLEIEIAPAAGRGESRIWTFALDFPEDEAMLMTRAVAAILAEQDREWKRVALSEFGDVHDLTVAVAVRSTAEWAGLLSELKGVPVVREVRPEILAMPESRIGITFQGTIEQLRLALAQQGLTLAPAGTGYALTRRPATLTSQNPEE